MIRAAILFFLVGLVAVFFGAYGIAGISMEAGRLVLGVFLFLAVASLVASLFTGKTPHLPS